MKIDETKKNNEKFIEEYKIIKNKFMEHKEEFKKLKKAIKESKT